MKDKIQGEFFWEKKRENSRVNLLQFSPYFPPHKGWIETVAEEISDYWLKGKYWEIVNVVFDIWQIQKINYTTKWYSVLLLPSFEIISNFPFPKFWKKEFWKVFSELKEYIKNNKEIKVVTHTRFFLSSFIAGLFAKKFKLKWIHLEHGSDYVKVSSKFKSKLSYYYDRLIWKWIFKKADIILAISNACKKFIQNEFIDREVEVFYRWMDFSNIKKNTNKTWDISFLFVWRLVNLKWVTDLVESYIKWNFSHKLVIIWDGEEKSKLEKQAKNSNINFLWFQSREFIFKYLQNNNCILINPSYQEGMPTTVLEGLMNSCPVLASDVWGTREISLLDDLQLFQAWNKKQLIKKMNFVIKNYNELQGKSFYWVNNTFDWIMNIEILYNKIK